MHLQIWRLGMIEWVSGSLLKFSRLVSTVNQCLANLPEEPVLHESAEAEDSEDVVTNGETAISERNSDSEGEDLSTNNAINCSDCFKYFSN
jgi:hypothetical protein